MSSEDKISEKELSPNHVLPSSDACSTQDNNELPTFNTLASKIEEESEFNRPLNIPTETNDLETLTVPPISEFVPNGNRRKSLIIGVNYYGQTKDRLPGCVHSAKKLTQLLLGVFKFKPN